MNKSILYQTITAVIILILLLFAANPLNFWMPSALIMLLVCSIAIAFFAFTAFLFQEKPRDEREQLHNLIAGKIAFFVGSTILVVATIVKELEGKPDPWILSALGAMVFTKIIVRIITELKQ
jgi:hypothetical protein